MQVKTGPAARVTSEPTLERLQARTRSSSRSREPLEGVTASVFWSFAVQHYPARIAIHFHSRDHSRVSDHARLWEAMHTVQIDLR